MASYYEAMVDMGESSSEFTHQIELVGPFFHPCESELFWPAELARLHAWTHLRRNRLRARDSLARVLAKAGAQGMRK